jgi:hypothetical protein
MAGRPGQSRPIDEIVAPGVNLNPGDSGWQNPAQAAAARRRD